jgi:hypothetical protein
MRRDYKRENSLPSWAEAFGDSDKTVFGPSFDGGLLEWERARIEEWERQQKANAQGIQQGCTAANGFKEPSAHLTSSSQLVADVFKRLITPEGPAPQASADVAVSLYTFRNSPRDVKINPHSPREDDTQSPIAGAADAGVDGAHRGEANSEEAKGTKEQEAITDEDQSKKDQDMEAKMELWRARKAKKKLKKPAVGPGSGRPATHLHNKTMPSGFSSGSSGGSYASSNASARTFASNASARSGALRFGSNDVIHGQLPAQSVSCRSPQNPEALATTQLLEEQEQTNRRYWTQ